MQSAVCWYVSHLQSVEHTTMTKQLFVFRQCMKPTVSCPVNIWPVWWVQPNSLWPLETPVLATKTNHWENSLKCWKQHSNAPYNMVAGLLKPVLSLISVLLSLSGIMLIQWHSHLVEFILASSSFFRRITLIMLSLRPVTQVTSCVSTSDTSVWCFAQIVFRLPLVASVDLAPGETQPVVKHLNQAGQSSVYQ